MLPELLYPDELLLEEEPAPEDAPVRDYFEEFFGKK